MSSSPFPQLLKRANISTYDPLITRIYTSTPSSKSQHSDWGLKFSVPIKKGPRYIKFNSLDAGPGVNCDWRSGEREARFIQAWGDGKVRWQNEEEAIPWLVKSSTSGFDNRRDDLLTERIPPEGGAEEDGGMWMRDVESMSEKEFEAYLDKIRKGRKAFLNERLEGLSGSIKETLVLPEDRTLIHLSYTGKTPLNSTLNYQADLTTSEIRDRETNKLNSKPHRTNGMVYSSKPTSSNEFLDTALSKKGRVLNKVSRYDESSNKSRRPAGPGMGVGNNLPWVVSIGGITGKTSTHNSKTTDQTTYMNSSIDQTDYTRSNNSAGVGKFRINRAEMGSTPPSVLALNESRYSGPRLSGKWRQSSANQPSPLDTFRFDVDLSITEIESESEKGLGEVGSREWVGSESRLNSLQGGWQDELNLGGPRRERTRGEAQERLREKESRSATMERLQRLLKRNKVEGGEGQGQGGSQ
ncbi:hypothetical protein I302_103083 [Kwoniella bestiolae CBS 10118]|uniref:Uncharacterized protein n=1 Tax=Kwoniella bestiolae CBS 10118 TaxID=1296100 RepID=A0A1B9GGT7_9TREE|nr:hypothetical protein I302_01782 [Kwoniella bestiolae CBS 10118]OCF30263.1 hypothetical protein I302_01782 [Kwoniella bestiolae CBS 10118]